MRNILMRCLIGPVLGLIALLVLTGQAKAVPDLAAQTGQPCTMCHIGGYGPQLTPFGRAFKIGGYTQRGGDGWASKVPLSMMVQGSFTNTQASLPSDQIPHHYASNNNFSIDQISGFLAGGIGEHVGGFLQFTYSPVDNTSALDNTDLRPFTTEFDVGQHSVRFGLTVNNNPTVLGLSLHCVGYRANPDRECDAGVGLQWQRHRLHDVRVAGQEPVSRSWCL
jgi:hypothetical protein